VSLSPEDFDQLLAASNEDEHLEFKEAKQQFDIAKLLRYCVALANEGGGKLVLGVSDRAPRKVVGTQAFADLSTLKARIVEAIHIRVQVDELTHPDGTVPASGIQSGNSFQDHCRCSRRRID